MADVAGNALYDDWIDRREPAYGTVCNDGLVQRLTPVALHLNGNAVLSRALSVRLAEGSDEQIVNLGVVCLGGYGKQLLHRIAS